MGVSVIVEGGNTLPDRPVQVTTEDTFLSVCQKVIVKCHINNTANLIQILFIFQSSSSKFMTTLILTGHQHNLQDLFLMVYHKVFDTGVVSGLCACVLLQMLLDLSRKHS